MADNDSNITLNEFLKQLDEHDWYYSYSDDHRSYKKGSENSRRLVAIAEGSEALKSLYVVYCGFINGKGEKPTIAEEKSNTPPTAAKGFTLNNLKKLVSDGKIFHVEFIKRSTGELRKMRCRIGVKKHLKGGGKAYSTKAKQLLTVFDMEANGYRSIPVEGIRTLQVGGQRFSI
tara:strand:+ start:14955 stop:15476 length:522 start_codon:yes stop_codon:yes gene_type:complete